MRFYSGQRFVGQVAGVRHLFTTTERYPGAPVEVQGGGATFPTHVLAAMIEAGTATPDHSCMDGKPATVPAFLTAERCAACQPHVSNVEAPAAWLEAVYGRRSPVAVVA